MEKQTLSEKLKGLMGSRTATNVGLVIIAILLLTLVLKQFPWGFVIEALIVLGVIIVCCRISRKKE